MEENTPKANSTDIPDPNADLNSLSNEALKRAVSTLQTDNSNSQLSLVSLMAKISLLEAQINKLNCDNLAIKNKLKEKDETIEKLSNEVDGLLDSNYVLTQKLSATGNASNPSSPIRKKTKQSKFNAPPEHEAITKIPPSIHEEELSTPTPPPTTSDYTKNSIPDPLLTQNPFYVLNSLENDMETDENIILLQKSNPETQVKPKSTPPTPSANLAPPTSSPTSEQREPQATLEDRQFSGFSFPRRTSKKLPPVTITEFGNWVTLREELQRLCTEKFTAKTYGEQIKIQFTNISDYRAAAHLFNLRKIQHIVFHIPDEPILRVIIKRVHESINLEDIISELTLQDINITKLTRLRKSPLNTAPALVLAQLSNNSENRKIYNVTEILGTSVVVESFKKKKDTLQCFNCQGFHHGSLSCHLKPQCVKCGRPHPTQECRLPPNSTPHCVNCKGDHVASYRGCPKFPRTDPQPTSNQQSKPHQPPPNPTDFPGLGPEKSLFPPNQPKHFPSYAAAAKSTPNSQTNNIQQLLQAMATQQAQFMSTIHNLIANLHA